MLVYFHQIETVIESRGNRDGARELLSRIVQKKDWFSQFLVALRETQHESLADDLSGNTGGTEDKDYELKNNTGKKNRSCKPTSICNGGFETARKFG